MDRQKAMEKAVVFRRGNVTIMSDETGIWERQHESINKAKRETRGTFCVALRKGEVVPDRSKSVAQVAAEVEALAL